MTTFRVEWNHTTVEFSLLRTRSKLFAFNQLFLDWHHFDKTLSRVSVWWENGSLYEFHDVEGTEIQLEVLGEAVRGAQVSLQVTPITAIVVLFYLDVDIDIIPNLILQHRKAKVSDPQAR